MRGGCIYFHRMEVENCVTSIIPKTTLEDNCGGLYVDGSLILKRIFKKQYLTVLVANAEVLWRDLVVAIMNLTFS
jgi:hypothetical protein